jgi:alpha-D-ribose 1-methylphosphonate 5-phosphate C-P lyase
MEAGYNFAYLDEATKRMIRRAILKAVAIPGHQIPFGAREMPLPYGWGTGGIQVTASIIGPEDTLKVIDQGADDTTNAISIRRFFARVADVAKRRCGKTRSWSTKCRCRSRCSVWSRALRRRSACTRSPITG